MLLAAGAGAVLLLLLLLLLLLPPPPAFSGFPPDITISSSSSSSIAPSSFYRNDRESRSQLGLQKRGRSMRNQARLLSPRGAALCLGGLVLACFRSRLLELGLLKCAPRAEHEKLRQIHFGFLQAGLRPSGGPPYTNTLICWGKHDLLKNFFPPAEAPTGVLLVPCPIPLAVSGTKNMKSVHPKVSYWRWSNKCQRHLCKNV